MTPPTTKVRTTLMLPSGLVKEAKHFAIDHERDLQDVVADAIRQYLAAQAARKKGAA